MAVRVDRLPPYLGVFSAGVGFFVFGSCHGLLCPLEFGNPTGGLADEAHDSTPSPFSSGEDSFLFTGPASMDLHISPAITSGQTVTLSYTARDGDNGSGTLTNKA